MSDAPVYRADAIQAPPLFDRGEGHTFKVFRAVLSSEGRKGGYGLGEPLRPVVAELLGQGGELLIGQAAGRQGSVVLAAGKRTCLL